jgi:hypothetical protein
MRLRFEKRPNRPTSFGPDRPPYSGAVSKVVNVYFVVSLVLPLVSFALPICQTFMAFNHQGHQGKPKGHKGTFDTAPILPHILTMA